MGFHLTYAVSEIITGFTRRSGLISVCLSLACLFWGSRRRGFVAVVLPEAWLGLIYRRRRDMCCGYSQSSLVEAKTATLLLPAHLESRLSGSAERLTPSLLPSPHLCIHPSASAAASPLHPPTTIMHYFSSCQGSIEI